MDRKTVVSTLKHFIGIPNTKPFTNLEPEQQSTCIDMELGLDIPDLGLGYHNSFDLNNVIIVLLQSVMLVV